MHSRVLNRDLSLIPKSPNHLPTPPAAGHSNISGQNTPENQSGVVAHTFSSSTGEAKAGGAEQPGLHRETPVLKKTKIKIDIKSSVKSKIFMIRVIP